MCCYYNSRLNKICPYLSSKMHDICLFLSCILITCDNKIFELSMSSLSFKCHCYDHIVWTVIYFNWKCASYGLRVDLGQAVGQVSSLSLKVPWNSRPQFSWWLGRRRHLFYDIVSFYIHDVIYFMLCYLLKVISFCYCTSLLLEVWFLFLAYTRSSRSSESCPFLSFPVSTLNTRVLPLTHVIPFYGQCRVKVWAFSLSFASINVLTIYFLMAGVSRCHGTPDLSTQV